MKVIYEQKAGHRDKVQRINRNSGLKINKPHITKTTIEHHIQQDQQSSDKGGVNRHDIGIPEKPS